MDVPWCGERRTDPGFLRSADLETASDAFGDYVPSRKELLSQHTFSFSTAVNSKKGHYYHKIILSGPPYIHINISFPFAVTFTFGAPFKHPVLNEACFQTWCTAFVYLFRFVSQFTRIKSCYKQHVASVTCHEIYTKFRSHQLLKQISLAEAIANFFFR